MINDKFIALILEQTLQSRLFHNWLECKYKELYHSSLINIL